MSIDLFDIRSLLNEEEQMVSDNVSRFVDDNVKPIIQESFEKHEFPHQLIQPIADLGLLGSSIKGYECAGMNAISYGLICKELEKGDSGIRSFVSVQSSLVMYPIHAFGSDQQKEHLPGVIGLKGPLSCLTQARYGISWGVIGAAEACLEQLIEYTQTRVLFDRTLDENQAIQIRLADMQRRIVTSSLLSYRLGQLKDEGKMDPTQVSLAKWNNVRMALDVARDARDMLGGSGISAEYVPIRHMLNLESVITYEGTETIHQLTVGRGLTGKNAF